MDYLLGGLGLAAGIALYFIIAMGADPEGSAPRWMQLTSGAIVSAILLGSLVYFVLKF